MRLGEIRTCQFLSQSFGHLRRSARALACSIPDDSLKCFRRHHHCQIFTYCAINALIQLWYNPSAFYRAHCSLDSTNPASPRRTPFKILWFPLWDDCLDK